MIVQALNQIAMLKAAGFLALLGLLLGLEAWRPRRVVPSSWHRRANNLGLIALSTVVLRVLFPLGAVGFAAAWQSGVFHQVDAPWVVKAGASLVLLDLAIYWQHRAFHYWPLLWRAHRVHHSDTGFDVSLGVRFHPFEILPSYAYKLLIVAVFGIAPGAVAIYEISLLSFSLLTHANVALPATIDRVLRRVIVTPDWHRVHHSILREEMNANFGNILSLWDRLFGTAREAPRAGQTTMTLGLPEFRTPIAQRFGALLIQPFVTTTADTSPRKDTPHA